LHPDLLPALARLIVSIAERSQIWVVSHSTRLITALLKQGECSAIELKKELGQTVVIGQDLMNRPTWHWPDKL
jgi:predicted ATPase